MCTLEEVSHLARTKKIVAVGDVTAGNLNKAGVPLLLEIVDLKTQRKEDGIFPHVEGSIHVRNPAATLTAELFRHVEESLKKGRKTRIEVDGEEDLAVIPIIFYSDLNTVVVYGVPNKGMACIEIDENTKEYAKDLVKRMEEE